MLPERGRWRRRCGAERGAAFVELALVAPILVVLVFGVAEFALAWDASLTVSTSLRTGARVASGAGTDGYADWDALQGFVSAAGSLDLDEVERLVIYDATAAADGAPPPDCVDLPVANARASGQPCNIYTAAQLSSLAQADFESGGPRSICAPTDPDAQWCPLTDRSSDQSALSGPDHVGVWVRYRHGYVTGLDVFGSGVTMTDKAVMQLEPNT